MRSTLLQGLLATALTAALYSASLDRVPPHLLHDEIKGALQSQSIADTGRDRNGRLLPLYFPETGFSVGRDPVSIYLTALVLKVLPISEFAIRLPSALVGALGVGLTFVLARLWFPGTLLPWVAAATLAFAPGYFIHSRLGHQVIYPVPFALLWLIFLSRYLAHGRLRDAYASGAAIGFGVYSYLAAVITMPTYAAATLAVLLHRGDWRGARAMATACALALAPLVAWQFVQPERYSDMLSAYRLMDGAGQGGSAMQAAATGVEWLRVRLDTFWDAFNPSRWYFTGESSLNVSTRQAGIVLLPAAIFMLAGIVQLVRAPWTPMRVLLIGIFVTAPLPAVVMADVEVRRWLVAIPYAALIATYGAQTILAGGRAGRAVAICLLALMPLQFLGFARDYFGDYPVRSAVWFAGNIRGALDVVFDAAGTSSAVVYLDQRIPSVEVYWEFYTASRGQARLLPNTLLTRGTTGLEAAPAGAIFVTLADEATAAELRGSRWSRSETVSETMGPPLYAVYLREAAP